MPSSCSRRALHLARSQAACSEWAHAAHGPCNRSLSCHGWQLALPLPGHEQAQQAWGDQACGCSGVSEACSLKLLAQLILGWLNEMQENGQAVTAKGRETTEQPPLNFVVGAHREAFAAVANKHLAAVVAQLLAAEGIQDVATWCPLITQMGQQAAQALSPSAMAAHGVSDPRHYIKVGAESVN